MADETNPTQPIRRLRDNELSQIVAGGFDQGNSPEPGARERNERRALDELGAIETLRQSSAFQWFSDTCIERNFKESKRLLEEINLAELSPRAVARLLAVFQTWREIAIWLTQREIEHRRLLNPKDPKLDLLRADLELH